MLVCTGRIVKVASPRTSPEELLQSELKRDECSIVEVDAIGVRVAGARLLPIRLNCQTSANRSN